MEETIENLAALIKENTTISNVSNVGNKILTATTPSVDAAPASHGILGWMLHLIASVILGVTRLFVWALSFATITIPTLIFRILSFSFTLTLNFSSLHSLLHVCLMVDYFSPLFY
jgi:hypothetical protein